MAIKILSFKKTIAAAILALAVIGGVAAEAYARNCTTTCTPNYGGGSTCNTYCW